MVRKFTCEACQQKHEKPINEECPYADIHQEEDQSSEASSDIQMAQTTRDSDSDATDNSELDSGTKAILAKLSAMDEKISTLNSKVSDNTRRLDAERPSTSSGARPKVKTTSSSVIPSLQVLDSPALQRQVDARLRDLQEEDHQGRYKSQRGGETVYVKRQVKWPQNAVLTGSSNSRVSYDQLNPFTFVVGFVSQIRDEKDIDVKNAMLEYLRDLYEDANDFSFLAAKNCHAVVCCRMEEDRLDWMDTFGLDRCRRHYAQRHNVKSENGKKPQSKFGKNQNFSSGKRNVAYIFYQKNSCHHSGDHETVTTAYKHACLYCFARGNFARHRERECTEKPVSKN